MVNIGDKYVVTDADAIWGSWAFNIVSGSIIYCVGYYAGESDSPMFHLDPEAYRGLLIHLEELKEGAVKIEN